MKYQFDRQRSLRTLNGKMARFWTTRGARRTAIKAANTNHIEFSGTCVPVSKFWRFKNHLVVLVLKDSVYKGEPLLNADGTPNKTTLERMKREYGVNWED